MAFIAAALIAIVLALACVGAWAALLMIRTRLPKKAPPVPRPVAARSSVAATDGSAVSEDRSAQIDATRNAIDAQTKETASLAASKAAVEPFVGDELSGYL